MSETDWVAWHAPYDVEGSALSQRLVAVQRRIRDELDGAAPGPIRVISLCAGQGRDLLGVLEDHPRRGDVRGRLVELDPDNVAYARNLAARVGATAVEIVEADASATSAYTAAIPADLVLACGVFGNISDDDIARTVEHLPTLCAPGATVIWTRHRRPPDLTIPIREWFTAAGFEEVGFDAPANALFGVGTHRLVAEPKPFLELKLFTFTGTGRLRRARTDHVKP